MPNGKRATARAISRQPRLLSRWRTSRPIADRRPRPQRWHDAVNELLALQSAYNAWLEALPDSLQDTATAEALRTIVDLDLEALSAVTPPRGYGRD